jgi:hypothetical protein
VTTAPSTAAAPVVAALPRQRGAGAVQPPYGRRLRAALRNAAPALAGYLAVRTVCMLVFVAWAHLQGQPLLAHPGSQWDTNWYLDLASNGYDTGLRPPGPDGRSYSNLAFFPLYPALIAAAGSMLPVGVGHAALGLSWLAALAAAWGVYATVAAGWGRRTGTLATLLWAALPHAVVMNIPYTEALFTALAAWALWAAVTRRWLTAGLLSTLACLTRPTGIAVAAAVCAAAAVELVRLRRSGGELRRPVLGALISPLGWFGYVAWVGLRLGHWDGYFTVQRAWDSYLDFGRSTLAHIWGTMRKPLSGVCEKAVSAVLAASVWLFVRSVRQRVALPLLVFSAVMLLITLADAGAFLSRARFLTPVFPLLIPPAAALARSGGWRRPAVVLGIATAVSAGYGFFLVNISASSL